MTNNDTEDGKFLLLGEQNEVRGSLRASLLRNFIINNFPMRTIFSRILLMPVIFLAGCQIEPTPQTVLPAVSTTMVSSVTASGASSGGNVTSDGGAAVFARGIVWGTASGPTTLSTTKTADGAGEGSFTSSLTGLTPNTAYFVRAYATNSVGTAYGNEVTFTSTSPSAATLTTRAVTTITGTTSISGGNVTNDGGSAITARGVCWGTSPSPTVSLGTKTSDGSGAGGFTSNITGLVDGTRYYVRAYCTNSVGTAYGNEFTFRAIASFTALDDAIAAEMIQYGMAGAAVAIVRNEKLVYVKSYGLADLESNQPVTEESIWRIASVSKPITVVAILKLVKDGSLTLDQKVFGSGGILGNEYGIPPPGSSKDLITVRHLIEHKSGWDNSPGDPMFSTLSNTQAQLITDLLANRPLATAPGSTYYYLNFGYCVLGRVVSKVSGVAYDSYVKAMLAPMGITDMKIGANTLAERFPNEVKYYQAEFSPYQMNVGRLDAAGGWLASASDLARFMVHVDRNSAVPDVVPSSLLTPFYFGFPNWAHYGSLPGTSSILRRMNDTFSYVLITNTRTNGNVDIILNDLNDVMSTQVAGRASWPTYDLFD